MPGKTRWLLIMLACLAVFTYSIYRDISYSKGYSFDLRNRVVGARLIKDGLSPYFYKWKNGDGIRYYDPQNFDSLRVSNITATPFFHHLLAPLAEWPQERIKWIWLIIEYGMLLSIVAMAFSLADSDIRRWAVLGAALLFLLTDAWLHHIFRGQNYGCIPFFAMAFYYCLQRGRTVPWALAAGMAAIILVFIRPNVLLFFIPFLFLFIRYPLSYKIAFLIPVIVLVTWTFVDPQERGLWQSYRQALAEQVSIHQGDYSVRQQNDPAPRLNEWEGIIVAEQDAIFAIEHATVHSENGNFFVLINKFLHSRIGVRTLAVGCLGVIVVLAGLFYFTRLRTGQFDLAGLAIFAYCLYMLSDLFSPVHRHQYYTVQWLFPALLAAAVYRPALKWAYALLLTGLAMNIGRLPFIPMIHSIGEYMMLATLLYISFHTAPAAHKAIQAWYSGESQPLSPLTMRLGPLSPPKSNANKASRKHLKIY